MMKVVGTDRDRTGANLDGAYYESLTCQASGASNYTTVPYFLSG